MDKIRIPIKFRQNKTDRCVAGLGEENEMPRKQKPNKTEKEQVNKSKEKHKKATDEHYDQCDEEGDHLNENQSYQYRYACYEESENVMQEELSSEELEESEESLGDKCEKEIYEKEKTISPRKELSKPQKKVKTAWTAKQTLELLSIVSKEYLERDMPVNWSDISEKINRNPEALEKKFNETIVIIENFLKKELEKAKKKLNEVEEVISIHEKREKLNGNLKNYIETCKIKQKTYREVLQTWSSASKAQLINKILPQRDLRIRLCHLIPKSLRRPIRSEITNVLPLKEFKSQNPIVKSSVFPMQQRLYILKDFNLSDGKDPAHYFEHFYEKEGVGAGGWLRVGEGDWDKEKEGEKEGIERNIQEEIEALRRGVREFEKMKKILEEEVGFLQESLELDEDVKKLLLGLKNEENNVENDYVYNYDAVDCVEEYEFEEIEEE